MCLFHFRAQSIILTIIIIYKNKGRLKRNKKLPTLTESYVNYINTCNPDFMQDVLSDTLSFFGRCPI